jgi:hypothetical protein
MNIRGREWRPLPLADAWGKTRLTITETFLVMFPQNSTAPEHDQYTESYLTCVHPYYNDARLSH